MNNQPRLFFATTNPGKAAEVRRFCELHGFTLLTAADLNVPKIEVPETGTTLTENAILKAQAYLDYVPDDVYVIGDDTGAEIDALNGEPGIYVRRWKDRVHEMTDQEIADYCLDRMKDVPADQRQARIKTVIAVAKKGEEIQLFEGSLEGRITEQQIGEMVPGFPFEVIFFSTEHDMLLADIHALPDEQKRQWMTHREKAILKGLQSFNAEQ